MKYCVVSDSSNCQEYFFPFQASIGHEIVRDALDSIPHWSVVSAGKIALPESHIVNPGPVMGQVCGESFALRMQHRPVEDQDALWMLWATRSVG